MAKANVVCTVHIAWWLMPYIHTLFFFCEMFDEEPDLDKLSAMLKKGIHVSVS